MRPGGVKADEVRSREGRLKFGWLSLEKLTDLATTAESLARIIPGLEVGRTLFASATD